MYSRRSNFRRLRIGILLSLLAVSSSFAGVSRTIQDKYRREYENKALFLRVPVFAERLQFFLSGQTAKPEPPPGNIPARFKVGDQVRVLRIDFGGEEIRFRVGAITGPLVAEIVYQFDSPLKETFPNSSVFDRALGETFTEGLQYADLEDAKRGYVAEQFERSVSEIASTAGTNREAVLHGIAPLLPAYQDAVKDLENLRRRGQELAGQLAQSQSEARKLETDLRNQQAEGVRLKSANQSLQERIDSSASQLSRLGEDLRSARGQTQGYQRELASLQRSLNIRIDAGQDLSSQIAELGQALRKLQQDNAGLGGQNTTFRNEIERLRAENSRRAGEIEELKDSARKLQETINTLSSKEDSLARQYLELKRVKESLEIAVDTAESLQVRMVEEGGESGQVRGRARVHLKNVLLGSLEWRLPDRLSPNEEGSAEVEFAGESIDYVKVTPEERHLLRSLGERLRVKVTLTSLAPSLAARAAGSETLQQIGERDRVAWRWSLLNSGTQDARLWLKIALVNRNKDEVKLFETEQLVASSSIVRQVRGYLQPIPLAIGAALGLILMGIVGIFRRVRPAHRQPPSPPPPRAAPTQKSL